MPKVIGITSGIGSLQYGFHRSGWEVGNAHEWRKYYNTGTFERNYGASVTEIYEPDPSDVGVDCIVSHPECGNYSNLYTGPNASTRVADPGDIFQFINLAAQYQPKVFLCDNLPKSLQAVSVETWRNEFLDYRLYFEYISNWGYGSVQKNRKRLFVIGVHRDLDWYFVPCEKPHELTIRDVISDLSPDTPNHQKMQLSDYTQWRGYQIGEPDRERLTLEELQEWLKDVRWRTLFPYYNKKGEYKRRPGYYIVDPDHTGPVLSGGGGFFDNHWILDEEDLYYRPLTMRERLRIQGFEDDFILVPEQFQYGTRDHQWLVKQTGKCMPTEFPYFFAKQLKEYLDNGVIADHEPSRLLDQSCVDI